MRGQSGETRRGGIRAQRYLITGILTVIPLWITWWVFNFLFNQLSGLGAPLVRGVARFIDPQLPMVAEFIDRPGFQAAMAFLLTLSALYLLGWLATQVIGKRLIAFFDGVMERIPLVERIYGSTKRLLTALQEKPESVQRVVLIAFPSPEMKAVGFVTRTFRDADTGEELAAVYVPTTPNPTSGYMEIVPLAQVVSTDWTVDEAVSFIISAGTITPGEINYRHSRGRAHPMTPGNGTD
ncbi:putative membrane protein [Natronocella acetinitrilica]|uniref:Membrane protein n=1 Tax=Natronocella acetinitrilica TaxID=414046 RepID=A0AAE3KCT0_9GAMM|nr:DUF502 domain-containing protein [Natronocella acetinitrilica]MCP1675378.1 putative membrane protein [Natronocella acetinitrilica]